MTESRLRPGKNLRNKPREGEGKRNSSGEEKNQKEREIINTKEIHCLLSQGYVFFYAYSVLQIKIIELAKDIVESERVQSQKLHFDPIFALTI